jgi:hypothetical protein
VLHLNLPDGRCLTLDADEVWHLTTRLVTADGGLPYAVGTAADLRLALKRIGLDGEIDLDERQAQAVITVAEKNEPTSRCNYCPSSFVER